MKIKRLIKKFRKTLIQIIFGIISFTIILSVWEVAARLNWVDKVSMPPPSKIYVSFWDWYGGKDFNDDFCESLIRGIVGLIIGVPTGIMLGLISGRIRIVDRFLSPVLNVVRAFPPVALIPVFLTLFGIGNISKILAIAFATVFPIWVNTHIGSSSIPVEYLRSGKLLTKSGIKLFFKIIFPASLTSIVAGTRISIAVAFIMLYVTELSGASHGLGYRVSNSNLVFRYDLMFASLFFLGIIAAAVDIIYVSAVKLFYPWLKLNGKTNGK